MAAFKKPGSGHTGNYGLYSYKRKTKKIICAHVFTDLLSLDQSKTFYKPDWFDIVGAEVKCCKEAVCVIDMSSFTKFELTVSHRTVFNHCCSSHCVYSEF